MRNICECYVIRGISTLCLEQKSTITCCSHPLLKTSSVNGGLYVKKTLYLQVKEAQRGMTGDWQADCVLLLWLSQLLLIPFDLAAVDSSIDAPVSPLTGVLPA